MKIAVFDNLPEGGAKRVVLEQIRFVHAKHHQVIHYTNATSTHFSPAAYVTKTVMHTLQLANFHGIFRPLTELSYAKLFFDSYLLARQIDSQECAVCIIHPCMITQAPLVLAFLKTPSLYFIEEPLRIVSESALFIPKAGGIKKWYELIRRKWIEQLDLYACQKATALATNSSFTQRNVLKQYKRHSIPLPLGVNTQDFFPATHTQNRSYFLWIGARDAVHGYTLLQSALSQLAQPPQIEYIEFHDEKLSLTDSQLRQKYQGAFATLCLSYNEPFGLTALESQACGTPVIAVDEGGYTDTVIQGVTGTLIKRTPAQLAKALADYSHNPKLVHSQGMAGVSHMRKEWSWSVHNRKLEKILQTIAKK